MRAIILALLLVLTVGTLFAAGAVTGAPDKVTTPTPPAGWPDWLVLVLGAVLPVVFQLFLSRLPGPVKALLCYLVGGAIGLAVGFLALGWKTPWDALRNIGYLWACMSFVYSFVIKPTAKKVLAKRLAGLGGDSTLARAFAPDK